jgi:ribose transport system substrate-binding protein
MKPTKVLVSLISSNNDYQKEQAASALQQAQGSNLKVEIVYADHDAVNQSQQLVTAIQNRDSRPEAILVEPVGTAMPQVASAAVAAGIAWGIVNCEVDYVSRLRRAARAPVFAVTTDQQEVGRIQGRQFAALGGSGTVLYIEGPGTSSTAKLRNAGMTSAKPANAAVKTLKGDWSEASGYRAIKSWLSLSTSRQLHIQVIGCQNDAMAAGARRAFQELPESAEKKEWLKLPFTGCDGVPGTGQKWVTEGLLAATVVIPPTMGIALRLLRDAINSGSQPPERTLSAPASFPTLPELAQRAKT